MYVFLALCRMACGIDTHGLSHIVHGICIADPHTAQIYIVCNNILFSKKRPGMVHIVLPTWIYISTFLHVVTVDICIANECVIETPRIWLYIIEAKCPNAEKTEEPFRMDLFRSHSVSSVVLCCARCVCVSSVLVAHMPIIMHSMWTWMSGSSTDIVLSRIIQTVLCQTYQCVIQNIHTAYSLRATYTNTHIINTTNNA